MIGLRKVKRRWADQNTKETSEYPRDIFASLARVPSWAGTTWELASLKAHTDGLTGWWGLACPRWKFEGQQMAWRNPGCAEIARSFVTPSHMHLIFAHFAHFARIRSSMFVQYSQWLQMSYLLGHFEQQMVSLRRLMPTVPKELKDACNQHPSAWLRQVLTL